MRLAGSALLLLVSACTYVTPQAVRVVPGQEFTLSMTESAALPGEGLLEFTEVASDSRCPRDVQCVWKGEAVTVLRASDPDESVLLKLNTAREDGARFGRWRIELLDLRPVPREGEILRQADYEVVLRLVEVEP